MARSINEIQAQITTVMVEGFANIGVELNSATWSATNILRLLAYIFSVSAHMVEVLFDNIQADVTTYISEMKPHSLRWYAFKAKQYQHGFALLSESDLYDNVYKTDDEIVASKIVKYAAVAESENEYGRISLRVKLATETGADLAPLNAEQLLGVKGYLQEVKDAGVPLLIESNNPDKLKMAWTIYYNPTILNNKGSRLDGTGENVVELAIKNYLKNLPFNGTFALAYITDEVQKVEGVVIPKIDLAQYKYGLLDWQNIDTWIVPDAGYLRLENTTDLVINYIATAEIK